MSQKQRATPSRAIRVVSTGACLPGPPIDNEALTRLVGPLPPEVLEGIQVQTRHWMIDPATGQHLSSGSHMAHHAALQALERAALDACDIDLLVMSTASPEYHLPATVTFVQELLGLSRCMVIELRGGCAGSVSALDIARRHLEDGTARRALVIGTEAISPLLAPLFVGRDGTRMRIRDRLNVYSFGDGAGAVILEVDENAAESAFLGSSAACLGADRAPGMQIIGAGTHAPIAEQLRQSRLVDFRVDAIAAGEFGPQVFVTALNDMLDATGLGLSEVDVCIVPEGNAGYFTAEMEAAGLRADEWDELQPKISENLAAVGATGSAAVPLALDDAWRTGRVKPGDRVFLLAIESSRWLYAGFGLTWSTELTAA